MIIGAQRCGTTSLQELLEAHPDIAMARPARPEPKVFLSPDSVRQGVRAYEATYFGHVTSESLLGEKSTSYLEDPAVPERVLKVLGPVPVVVQLRDPVSRAVSNWRFSTANRLERRPLENALEENLRTSAEWDRSRSSVSPYAYLERGRYADYLQPWFDTFADSMVVRFLEETSAEAGAMAQLYDALGVDPHFELDYVSPPARKSEGPTPMLSRQLVARLRDYFAPADEQLRKLLQRKLPWSSASRASPVG